MKNKAQQNAQKQRQMLCAQRRSNKYQFYVLWFHPIGARSHDLPHSMRVRQPFHHRSGYLNSKHSSSRTKPHKFHIFIENIEIKKKFSSILYVVYSQKSNNVFQRFIMMSFAGRNFTDRVITFSKIVRLFRLMIP